MSIIKFKTLVQWLFKLGFVCSILAISYLALSNQEAGVQIPHFDKLNHVIAFFWLSFLYCFGWSHAWWFRALVMFSIGFAIEAIQYFIPYRSASSADLIADAIGILLFEFFRYGFRKRN